jgi:salicylate hydroxylase
LVGLADAVTQQKPHLGELCDQTYTGKILGISYLPAKWQKRFTQPACGIKRTTLNLALKNALIDADIELHEGWKLKRIVENDNSVVAISEDGQRVEGSILIGCDGINAISRELLFKAHNMPPEEATYTGLMQVR